jgi:hypothetical protein
MKNLDRQRAKIMDAGNGHIVVSKEIRESL